MRLEMEARLRNLGLCPQGGDWPHLNCVLKRWLCCPVLRQAVGDEALQGMGRKLDMGPRGVGVHGSSGLRRCLQKTGRDLVCGGGGRGAGRGTPVSAV